MAIWGGEAPESCDCCGRDAEDCGMLDTGWVSDGEVVRGGSFCRGCAHLLWIERTQERCGWCGGGMQDETRADAHGWAYFVDEVGELHACCAGCLAEHFGITCRVAVRRR